VVRIFTDTKSQLRRAKGNCRPLVPFYDSVGRGKMGKIPGEG
jgi:hypothetical protein